jgi:hypothetical protein
MKIVCCDGCQAVIDTDYGSEKNTIDNGQVMRIGINVIIDNGLLEVSSPIANEKLVFCSASCALEYLTEFKKIEDYWIQNWKKGGKLGKKCFFKSGGKK